MYRQLRRDVLNWFVFHAIAVACFVVGAGVVASFEPQTSYVSVFRKEMLMASGAWGSWIFLTMASTRWMKVVAKSTILFPSIAMVTVSAFAFVDGGDPDRWNQWLLSGLLSAALVFVFSESRRLSLRQTVLRLLFGATLSTIAWQLWLEKFSTVGDPTLHYVWNAPLVAVLTATILPAVLFGQRRPIQSAPKN